MKPKTGIILGSGLSGFEKELASPGIIIEDNDSFHKIKIVSGEINGEEIILFCGRKHFYEGFEKDEVLGNVILAKELGLELLVITNAAGGINKNFRVSDLMIITSHINFIKKNIPPRSSSAGYETNLIREVKRFGLEEKITLRSGTYCCSSGPMYETKSEIKFLTRMGADAVGMSTVPEMLFAGDNGMKTIALSCITNLLSENSDSITNHEEVIEAGKNSYANLSRLLKRIIKDSSRLIQPN